MVFDDFNCCCGPCKMHIVTGSLVIAIVGCLFNIGPAILAFAGQSIISGVLYILAVLMYLSVIFAQQKRSHRFYLPYLIVMAIGLIGLALYILVYIGIFIVGPESMMGIDNPELKMHLRLFFGIVLIPLLIIFTFNIWFYLVIYKAYKYLKDAPAAVHYPNPNA